MQYPLVQFLLDYMTKFGHLLTSQSDCHTFYSRTGATKLINKLIFTFGFIYTFRKEKRPFRDLSSRRVHHLHHLLRQNRHRPKASSHFSKVIKYHILVLLDCKNLLLPRRPSLRPRVNHSAHFRPPNPRLDFS